MVHFFNIDKEGVGNGMKNEKAVIAAITAALEAYISAEYEERERKQSKTNLWRLHGFQDSMNIRQQWQQRVGVAAGSPVNRRAYPLLAFNNH